MAFPSTFQVFGALHLAILACMFFSAVLLVAFGRAFPALLPALRVLCATGLLATLFGWHGWMLWKHWGDAVQHLPLQLCDAVLVTVATAAITMEPRLYSLSYYFAFAPLAALISPVLWEIVPSFGTVYFFLTHCGTVVVAWFLVRTGRRRRLVLGPFAALVVVNSYALLIALLNQLFGTNYMFLCAKPAGCYLLDLLGPWPYYLIAAEAIAIASLLSLFLLHRLYEFAADPAHEWRFCRLLVPALRYAKGSWVRIGTFHPKVFR